MQQHIKNEEATKHALVMPFISALGYDVYNPTEVSPEFTADVPGKKGEKVDYAIIQNEQPIILIECKCCTDTLEDQKHPSQLNRYFSVTDTKFGILTNGIVYRFYTDIEKSHVMDEKPFFEFNMLNFNEVDIAELKRFSKSIFNQDELCDAAQNLLYTREIKKLMAEQLTNPSTEFVKFFASQVYSGRMTSATVATFTEITKRSLKEFINERITDRLNKAIDLPENSSNLQEVNFQAQENIIESDLEEKEVIITEEELEGFYTVKSILRKSVDIGRINHKKTKKYFGINLDSKVTKTICRLRFYPTKKSIGIIDATGKEAKKDISSLDEIYGIAEILIDRVNHLTQEKYVDASVQSEVN